jgi:hypothetical protein
MLALKDSVPGEYIWVAVLYLRIVEDFFIYACQFLGLTVLSAIENFSNHKVPQVLVVSVEKSQ